MEPKRAGGWISLSISLYRLGRTQDAWNCLSAVAEQFSDDWLFAYNLACYATQLGNLPEAEKLIHQAMELGDKGRVRELVFSDPDLEPIRKAFAG